MILKYQVRWYAEEFIRTTLKDYPGVRNQLMVAHLWDKFVDLTHVRCNEMILIEPRLTQTALRDFIQDRVIFYVRIHRDKLQGTWTEEKAEAFKFKAPEKIGTAADRASHNKIWGNTPDDAA